MMSAARLAPSQGIGGYDTGLPICFASVLAAFRGECFAGLGEGLGSGRSRKPFDFDPGSLAAEFLNDSQVSGHVPELERTAHKEHSRFGARRWSLFDHRDRKVT